MIINNKAILLIKKSFLALAIKVGAAGLQFLMFLVIARSMPEAEYGIFGFAFSLSTLTAVVGSFGFRMLSLRFIQLYESETRPMELNGLLRDGISVTFLGTIITTAIACVFIYLGAIEMSIELSISIILFSLSISLAEYYSFVLRGFEYISLSLVPRDIIWRVLSIILVIIFSASTDEDLSSTEAVLILTGLLFLIVILQANIPARIRIWRIFRTAAKFERERWRSAAYGLWGVSVVQVAAPNLTIILLGLYFSPEDTGPIFAAMRIALLLNLVLLASNMAASLLIARLFHERDMQQLQETCRHIACMATLASLVLFTVFALGGEVLLGMFGGGFEKAYPFLMIMSGAYVINTFTGPTSVLLEVSGHERAAFVMLSSANIISIALLPIAIRAFGDLGAALCLALAISGWNLSAVVYARKMIGVDPSILSFFLRR